MTTGSPRAVPVHEYLLLDGEGPAASLTCSACGARICSVTENYRAASVLVSEPVSSLGQLFDGYQGTLDEAIVWRTYHCPTCGQRFDGEICPASAEPLWDLQLSPEVGER